MRNIFIFLYILLFILISLQTVEPFGPHRDTHKGVPETRILLRDVQVLTLKSGQWTKARRTSPIQQIECIGGTARKENRLYPQTIQCYNMGSNGMDVQWKCEANLDSTVKFGTIDVNCEGYAYPDDPYITADSCGVLYELEYSNEARRKAASGEEEASWVQIIFCIAFIGLVLYAVFNWCGSPQDDSNAAQNNTAADNNHPGDGNPGDGNPGGFQGYPNLNNNNNNNNNNNSNNNNNPGGCANNINNNGGGWFQPGLWTGLATGYLFGRSSNRNNYHYYTPSPSYNRSYRSSYGGGSGISSSSSSYSGTSRR
ncbi:hypothetical protein ACTA71_002226 [Dictyostelium dimigraforme]